MSYNQHYQGLIWTNHALERLHQRRMSQEQAYDAFKNPDKKFAGKQTGTTEFQKRVGKSLITIIAKQNEKYEWLILSCWVDPPFPGTEDYKKRQEYIVYRKSGFWKRVWLDIRKLILGF